MPLSAPNEELQHLVKNKVLAGALEKDRDQEDLSLLPVAPFRGIHGHFTPGPPNTWCWDTEGIEGQGEIHLVKTFSVGGVFWLFGSVCFL